MLTGVIAQHKRKSEKMRIFLVIVFVLLLSASFIISNHDIRINKPEEASVFYSLYLGWLNQVFVNFQDITGSAIRMQWIPGNRT